MRKVLLVVLLLPLFAVSGYSQQGFHVGVTGNLNSVWIINQNAYGLKEYDYKLDIGGGGGIALGYNLTDHFGFQAEVKSSKQGQKYVDHRNSSLVRDVTLNYVAIPVLVKVIGGSSNVRFYADAGIQYNILSNARLSGEYDILLLNTNAREMFNKSDVGFNFGLGGDISLTDYLYLNVGMSFYYGFNDINAASGSGLRAYKFNTWQWPDQQGSGVYKASKNGTGGFNVGIHYLFSTDSGY